VITIEVMFFAGAREAVGTQRLEVPLSDGATIAGLIGHLTDQYPAFARVAATAQTAVNEEYASASYLLEDGDEVAVIPPVSGGLR